MPKKCYKLAPLKKNRCYILAESRLSARYLVGKVFVLFVFARHSVAPTGCGRQNERAAPVYTCGFAWINIPLILRTMILRQMVLASDHTLKVIVGISSICRCVGRAKACTREFGTLVRPTYSIPTL